VCSIGCSLQRFAVNIFGMDGLCPATIWSGRCDCGEDLTYTVADAAEDELFVIDKRNSRQTMRERLWIDFRLLDHYDTLVVAAGTTFRAFYDSMKTAYERTGRNFMEKADFINAYWDWNRARKLDFDHLYDCDECRRSPGLRVWVIDVTRLGIKRKIFASAVCEGCGTGEEVHGWFVQLVSPRVYSCASAAPWLIAC
jgi:hypothetical protein